MMHLRQYSNKWYSNLVTFSIENPLKTWWKARKYFKFPKVSIKLCSNNYHFPYSSKRWQGKILDINIHDLYWKDKYDSPRHECNPLIYICLFGRYSLWIVFGMSYRDEFNKLQDGSPYYWEYLLDYVYYSHNLNSYSCWTSYSLLYKYIHKYGETEKEDEYKYFKIVVPVVSMSLNKNGISKLKELLKSK